MFRPIVLILFILLSAPAARVQAATQCAFQDWMITLHYRGADYHADPSLAHFRALDHHRRAYSATDRRLALREQGLGHLAPALDGYLGVLDQLFAQPYRAIPLHQTDSGFALRWDLQAGHLHQAVSQLDCAQDRITAELKGIEGGLPGAMPLDKFATLVLALGVSAMCLTYLASKYLLRLRQIMKRHLVSLPCQVRSGRFATLGAVVDISRSGAKLQLDAPLEGRKRLKIRIRGQTYKARVAWQNRNFAGVRFASALTDAELQTYLGGQRKPAAPDAAPNVGKKHPGILSNALRRAPP